MAFLNQVKGHGAPRTIELDRDQFIFGRSPDCDIVLESFAISRRHAQIIRMGQGFCVLDLGARNHSYLNDTALGSVPVQLHSDDRLRMAEYLFIFQETAARVALPAEWGPPRSPEWLDEDICESDQVWIQPTMATRTRSLKEEPRTNWSVAGECRRLRECLVSNHVRAEYTPERYQALVDQLHDRHSRTRLILARGFYRFVLLDAKAGLDGAGRFDLEQFLGEAVRQLVQAFHLDPPQTAFAPEDMAQILKDERRSLFCFVNAQLIPEVQLTRLRCFTQEMHQALMLVEVNPGQEQELDRALDRVLAELLQTFPEAERVFLVLADEATEHFHVRALKERAAGRQTTARPSYAALSRCLKDGEGMISEGAQADAHFDASATVMATIFRSMLFMPIQAAGVAPSGALQLDASYGGRFFTPDDLERCRPAAEKIAALLQQVRQQQESATREALERDLALARHVQREFLDLASAVPKVPGYEFFAHCHAVGGGDFYAFVHLPDNRVAVAVGEVAGKGVRASSLARQLTEDLRARLAGSTEVPDAAAGNAATPARRTGAAGGMDPAVILEQLNQAFPETADIFATLLLAILDPVGHTLTLANAGHPSVLLCRKGQTAPESFPLPSLSGFPLGVVKGVNYSSVILELAPGDCVLFVTDGIAEARAFAEEDPAGFFGRQFLPALQARPPSAQSLGRHLIKALVANSAARAVHDDQTLLVLGREDG
jgi:serine phosphatase RsbU (regulator of sigma subunit)